MLGKNLNLGPEVSIAVTIAHCHKLEGLCLKVEVDGSLDL